jgi:L-alanine-DL-glutamate epimerase-like enolase superfamily enzyme
VYIADIKTMVTRLPLENAWADARKTVSHIELVVVDVTTDTGLVGTGISHSSGVGALAIESLVKDYLGPSLIGKSISPRALWEYGWDYLHDEGGGGVTTMALAALDIAFWDVVAKDLGRPLVDLLGRVRDRVPVYGSGINLGMSIDELLDQVDGWVGRGYKAVKVKVGKDDLEEDVERIAKVRERIGALPLMVDANQKWSAPEAARRIHALERFGLLWVEEPMLADDIEGQCRLRSQVSIPLAMGENVYTPWQFRDLIVGGAMDFVQADIGRVGGITPWLDIAALARTYNRPMAPHFMLELSADLLCCVPNGYIAEDIAGGSLTDLGALATSRTVVDGYLYASESPGHGLEFDRSKLLACRVGGEPV